MRHLAVFDAMAKQLQENLEFFNAELSGITDKSEIIRVRLLQNESLVEILRQQKRALRFHNGEQVEPEVHYAEARLDGRGFAAS